MEHRTGMKRDGVQAGTEDPTTVSNSVMVSDRNADLEQCKTCFGSKKNKEEFLHI